MNQFPIILIPPAIKQIQNELPPLPELPKPQLPSEPQPPVPLGASPQFLEIQKLKELVGFGLVVVFILNVLGGSGLGVFSFFSLVVFLTYYTWQNLESFPQRQQEYFKRQQNYEQAKLRYQDKLEAIPGRMKQYERDLQAYKEKLKNLEVQHHTPEKISAFRRERLSKVLRQTLPYDGKSSLAQEGSEQRLIQPLRQYFPGKIHTRLTLTIPGFDHPYSPDVAYIDESLNLYIDIEVDEPYVYKTHEPIHFIGKDEIRNRFFIQRGWLVIRFSEEQVVRYPNSCCKTVAQVVADLLANPSLMQPLVGIPDLIPIKQWTYREALEMAAEEQRDRYKRLPTEPPSKDLSKSRINQSRIIQSGQDSGAPKSRKAQRRGLSRKLIRQCKTEEQAIAILKRALEQGIIDAHEVAQFMEKFRVHRK